MKRYAIVGFGCAGYHALSALRESDRAAEIHVFSDLDQPPANPMLTTYYAAGRLPYEALFPFGTLEDITRQFAPVLHTGTTVTGMDAASRTLIWDGGQADFDAVLLATGADPVVPPLGVSVGNRVLCMRTVADAKALRSRLETGHIRSVTVIGGSMVGIKIVELCQEAGIICTLADMAQRIFPALWRGRYRRRRDRRPSDHPFRPGQSGGLRPSGAVHRHPGAGGISPDRWTGGQPRHCRQ